MFTAFKRKRVADAFERWRRIKLGRNDRGVLIGATGCGKTTLARFLIEDVNKPYSVVYDPKISESIGKWPHTFYYDFGQLQEAEERRLIYRPPVEEEQDAYAQNRFFQWVYWREHTRLYVDEAYALLGGSNPSFYLQACLSRGRERGISTLIATQRPSRIPLITLSEAEHFYIFRLNLPQDQRRIEEITGITVEEQLSLEQFQFFYWNAITGRHPVKLKLSI